jgi:hypothetical protein
MILYEPINTQQSSTKIPAEGWYSSEALALMPLVSSYSFEEHAYSPEYSWQYEGIDCPQYPFLVFDDEDNDEDIEDDDNFDDLDDDFDDEFEDDDFDDDDEYDDDYDDEYDDDEYDEFDEDD